MRLAGRVFWKLIFSLILGSFLQGDNSLLAVSETVPVSSECDCLNNLRKLNVTSVCLIFYKAPPLNAKPITLSQFKMEFVHYGFRERKAATGVDLHPPP